METSPAVESWLPMPRVGSLTGDGHAGVGWNGDTGAGDDGAIATVVIDTYSGPRRDGVLQAEPGVEAGASTSFREVPLCLRGGGPQHVVSARPGPVVEEVHGALGHDGDSVGGLKVDGYIARRGILVADAELRIVDRDGDAGVRRYGYAGLGDGGIVATIIVDLSTKASDVPGSAGTARCRKPVRCILPRSTIPLAGRRCPVRRARLTRPRCRGSTWDARLRWQHRWSSSGESKRRPRPSRNVRYPSRDRAPGWSRGSAPAPGRQPWLRLEPSPQ